MAKGRAPGFPARAMAVGVLLLATGAASHCAADSVSFDVTQSPGAIEMRHTGTAALFTPTLWVLDDHFHWRIAAPADRYGDEWNAGERRRFERSAFHGLGLSALIGQVRYREAGGWIEGHPFVMGVPERAMAAIGSVPFIQRLRLAPRQEGLRETWLIATERRLPMPGASPLTDIPLPPPDPAIVDWRATGHASSLAPLAWDGRLCCLLHRDKDGQLFHQRVFPPTLELLNRPGRLVVHWLFAIAAVLGGGAVVVDRLANARRRPIRRSQGSAHCANDVT